MTQVLKESPSMTNPDARMIDRFFRRWNWSRTGSVAINLTVAAFVVSCVMAKWTLAQAQEAQLPKTKAPDAKQKQKAKAAPAPSARAVPAAGTKVDALVLAKIIDQEIDRQ